MNDSTPSTAEIATLTARLRALAAAGAAADPAERAQFLADKDRLLDRISAASSRAEPRPPLRGRGNQQAAAAADDALDDAVRARADLGGYALVGPSARTWRTDPDTGRLLEPVSEAEHRTLRHLLGAEAVTTSEPVWIDTPHGTDIVSAVHATPDDGDSVWLIEGQTAANEPAADELDYRVDNQHWTGPVDDDDTDTRAHHGGAELGLTGGEGPPIDAGPALSAEEAAHELAADGRTIDEARAVVRCYLDDVSEQVGTSVHLWGLDEADLSAMRADPLERARTAAAVLNVASEAMPTATTEAEQTDEDGWSR